MNRKKTLMSFVIVAMLLCGSLVLSPVRATSSDWSKPRPSKSRVYDETIGNSQTDGAASIGIGVEISDYIENTETIPYDELRLRASASACSGGF